LDAPLPPQDGHDIRNRRLPYFRGWLRSFRDVITGNRKQAPIRFVEEQQTGDQQVAVVRQAVLSYYDGTQPYGNAGDLMLAWGWLKISVKGILRQEKLGKGGRDA